MNVQSTSVFSSLEHDNSAPGADARRGRGRERETASGRERENLCAPAYQINSCLDILILSSCVWSNQPTIEKQSSNYS